MEVSLYNVSVFPPSVYLAVGNFYARSRILFKPTKENVMEKQGTYIIIIIG